MSDEADEKLRVKVYNDALSPAIVEAGRGLQGVGSLIRLAFRPLGLLADAGNAWFDQLGERIVERIKRRGTRSVRQPPGYIVAPVVLYLPFVQDTPSLRDMFEELLAASMDAEQPDLAHPAFARIVGELQPREALIVQWIASINLRRFSLNPKHWSGGESLLGPGVEVALDNLERLNVLRRVDVPPTLPGFGDPHNPEYDAKYPVVWHVTSFGRKFLSAVAPPGQTTPQPAA